MADGAFSAADLRIDRATPADEPVLANLFQLYFHDFSDWSGEDVDEQGLFDAWDAEAFADPDNAAYLLRVGERLAGFLIVEQVETPRGPMTEFADLFILRKYRRAGLALEVVRRVMLGAGHPWLVAVFREDVKALAFWKSAFERLPFGAVRRVEDPERPQFFFYAVNESGGG